MKFKAWINAFRLRTLPLSFSSICLGAVLAAYNGKFDSIIFSSALITAFLLQVLSNLANDFGDTQNGADHSGRVGPERTVQSGLISLEEMKYAIFVFSFLSLLSGLYLLAYSLEGLNLSFIFFFILGVLAIVAAIKYTAGKNPYGYMGLGDISVFFFFGFVGVMGTFFLFTKSFTNSTVLPSISLGTFATLVLNLNNMRDIDSDKVSQKITIPVRIGLAKAKLYHWLLTLVGILSSLIYAYLNQFHLYQYLFLLPTLYLIKINLEISNKSGKELDAYLKKTALSVLCFSLMWSIGYYFSIFL